MFSKKANDTPSSFENIADDRSNQTRQHRRGFCPNSFKAITHFFPAFFQSFGDCPNNSPDCCARSQKDGGHRKPYFLKISLTLSRRGIALSLSPTWVCNRLSSSFLSAILSSAASLSEGEVFSSWMIAWSSSFWCLRLFSHSFSSSRAFVLFSLSSISFLSFSIWASFALSLSAFACDFSLFFACFSSTATSFF